MTKHDNNDKGRRAKLMFELVAAEDARNAALNPTTTAAEELVKALELTTQELVKALELTTQEHAEPDSALVAEVARLRGYLEKIREIATSTLLLRRRSRLRALTLIHEYASEAQS